MSVGNKYNSKQDFFIASDMYNLPMPALPPADLSLSASVFAPSYLFYRVGATTKVAGFTPNDNPYIRALGLNSNLADGLVPSSSGNSSFLGWQVLLEPEVFTAAIGNISNASGTPTQLTGAAGDFEKYLSVGATVMWLDDNKTVRSGVVSAIAGGGNSLTLSAPQPFGAGTMFAGDTTAKNIYVKVKSAGTSLSIPFLTLNVMNPYTFFAWQASNVYTPLGNVSIVTGSAVLNGNGTSFLTDYVSGQPIGWTDNVGVRRTGVVSTVTSNTVMTLQAVALSTATNMPILAINSFVAIKATMVNTFGAYTIAIDPAFGNGTRRLSISLMAEIEYSFAMTGAI